MIARPDLAHLPIGDVVALAGVPMRHIGGGLFEPATIGEQLAKRFDMGDGPLVHGDRAA